MKKVLKRFAAISLALMLMFTMGINVFAAENVEGTPGDDPVITAMGESVSVEQVIESINGLSADPRDYTQADVDRIEAIQADFESLSAEDQAVVDSTNHATDGQYCGRVLESAVWTVRSFTTDTSTTLAPGTYTTTTDPAVSSHSDKGKSTSSRTRNWWVESVTVSDDGQATAKIYVTGGEATAKKVTSYTSVWSGGNSYEKDSDNCYTIPVDLNGKTYFGGVSSSMPRPIMYELSTTIDEPSDNPADFSDATIDAIPAQVYTGKALMPNVTVKVGKQTLVKDTDYTVAYSNNTNAGTAKVTVQGKGTYSGTKETTFKINRANNPLTVSGKSVKIKKKKVRKKAQRLAAGTVLTISNAKGTVTYKGVGVNKKSKKALKINASSGQITVKKKTKKGTYKMKVTVTAAGNNNYNAASVTRTVTVKVKK